MKENFVQMLLTRENPADLPLADVSEIALDPLRCKGPEASKDNIVEHLALSVFSITNACPPFGSVAGQPTAGAVMF